MKKSIRIIAGLSVLLAAVSCQQFNVDTQMTPEKYAASVKMVSDALESYTLPAANPQPIIFNVSSNATWTITGNTEWLSVTPSSSSASGLVADVTVTAQENTGLEDRTATLTIKNDSYKTRVYTVQITQYRKGRLFVQPIYKDFVAAGGPLSFTIETNQAWEVRSSEGWLTFGKTSGNPDPEGKPVTVIATAEPSDVLERSAIVTVTAGDQEETFEVFQKGRFDITAPANEFNVKGETQVLKLRTDLPWEVKADQPWVSFDKEEGRGDGSWTEINVTAAENTSAVRKAVVTVKAGDAEQTFEVAQAGIAFNIVTPDDPTVNRTGGELIVEVNTTLDWTVATDNDAFTAEKIDATHFKVSAGWNPIFVERTANVTITAPSGITDSIEISQDTNFELENCELLEDGSVKMICANKSRVYLKDHLRCLGLVLTMGEKNFGDNANFWVVGEVGEEFGSVALYNWLNLGVKTRIRTEGNMNATGSTSYYKSTDYSISKSQLNSMETYEYKFMTNASDASLLDMSFVINGSTTIASHSGPNPFTADPDAWCTYFFGCWDATSDGTWYVVKSCDVTIYE